MEVMTAANVTAVVNSNNIDPLLRRGQNQNIVSAVLAPVEMKRPLVVKDNIKVTAANVTAEVVAVAKTAVPAGAAADKGSNAITAVVRNLLQQRLSDLRRKK